MNYDLTNIKKSAPSHLKMHSYLYPIWKKGLGWIDGFWGGWYYSSPTTVEELIFLFMCRNLTVRFVGTILTGGEGHLNVISKSHVTNTACVAWGFLTPSFLMRLPPSRSNFSLLVLIIAIFFEKRLGRCAHCFFSFFFLLVICFNN